MKKWGLFVLCALGALFLWRSRPVMQPEENYCSIFPAKKFHEKLKTALPEWMRMQIERDFRDVSSVLESSISRTYETICKRVPRKSAFYRYRILNCELYTYVREGERCATKDTRFEKALKTLLSYEQIPNIDFIYCQMDGLPEDYVPADFFLMDDPKTQAPILAQAKLKEPLTRYIVLIPDQFSLSGKWLAETKEIESLNQTISWEKKDNKAFWRGGFTDTGNPGFFLASPQKTARMEISYLSFLHPQSIDAGLTFSILPELEKKWQTEGILKKEASKQEHLLHKYLPILDGHMCTYPGYQWRLLSNCLCMKQESEQIQWFYNALEPYRHYLPIAHDMRDLLDQIKWAGEHEQKVLEIIQEAQTFAKHHLLMEDNYRYLTLVLKHYANMQSIDFSQTKNDPHWVCIQYRKRSAFFKMIHKKLTSIKRFSMQRKNAIDLKEDICSKRGIWG